MINIDDDPKEIIKELSETEKNILYVLGKMRISVNKNVSEHTLKKKLSNDDLKKIETKSYITNKDDGKYAKLEFKKIQVFN